jgi:lysozyme family protein
MTIDFNTAFDRLMGNEGGYTPGLPGDPGGETNWGISKRSYPNVDIKMLTRDGAKAIYYPDFWMPLQDAHPAIKFQCFDFAVQSGIQTAIRKLQAAVGAADDGYWGPLSAAKLAAMDVSDVLMLYAAQRLRFLTKCAVWQTMSVGLANRIANDLEFAAKDN